MILAVVLALAAQQPADFLREEESSLLHFRYGWPAAVEREPALRARLNSEMAAAYREAAANAREARRLSRARAFLIHEYSQVWEVRGTGGVLLSIDSGTFSFAGGAHGNHAVSAILWDLAAHRAVTVPTLLGPGLAGMSARYCTALDTDRAERRGEPIVHDPEDPFSLCPPLAEQVMVPLDSDGNGRLDTLRILLPPYAAGSYAEGEYEIDVPFEAQDLAAVPDNYRPDFEQPGERRVPLDDE